MACVVVLAAPRLGKFLSLAPEHEIIEVETPLEHELWEYKEKKNRTILGTHKSRKKTSWRLKPAQSGTHGNWQDIWDTRHQASH